MKTTEFRLMDEWGKEIGALYSYILPPKGAVVENDKGTYEVVGHRFSSKTAVVEGLTPFSPSYRGTSYKVFLVVKEIKA